MLAPVRHEKKKLAPRARQAPAERELPDRVPARPSARFLRDEHPFPPKQARHPLPKTRRLRGLSDAIYSLKDYKHRYTSPKPRLIAQIITESRRVVKKLPKNVGASHTPISRTGGFFTQPPRSEVWSERGILEHSGIDVAAAQHPEKQVSSRNIELHPLQYLQYN
jgi:hypothetical protein